MKGRIFLAGSTGAIGRIYNIAERDGDVLTEKARSTLHWHDEMRLPEDVVRDLAV
jgi:hypothetical protein